MSNRFLTNYTETTTIPPLGYNSKGYLFEFDDCYEVIIGSSNITRYALLKNIEWDVVVREIEPEVYSQVYAEFGDKWVATHLLNTDEKSSFANQRSTLLVKLTSQYTQNLCAVLP